MEMTGKTLRQEIIDRVWLSFGESGAEGDGAGDIFADVEELQRQLADIEKKLTELDKRCPKK